MPPFWNQKAFSNSPYWLLSLVHYSSAGRTDKTPCNVLQQQTWLASSSASRKLHKKIKKRSIFFCEGDLKKKNQRASVLNYTQGCITSVLTHIHVFLKLNSWIFSKKTGAWTPLGHTGLQFPWGSSGGRHTEETSNTLRNK